MKLVLRFLPGALACVAWLAGCGGGGDDDDDGDDSDDSSGGEVSFERDIAPVFADKCNFCHHPGSVIDVDLTRPFDEELGIIRRENSWVPNGSEQEFIVDPGNPDNSFILTKVSATSLEEEVEGAPMPFEFEPLDEGQLAAVRDWVEQGALDDATFEPVAEIFGTDPMSLGRAAGKCTFCHHPDSPPPRLDVTNAFDENGLVDVPAALGGTRVVPGDVEESVLIGKLEGTEGARMPFVPDRMTPDEIADLTAWIEAGAPNN
jgi:hypothetical protein